MADELLIEDLGDEELSPKLRVHVSAEATILGTVFCPVKGTEFKLYEHPVYGDEAPVLAAQVSSQRAVTTHWHSARDLADDLDLELK